MKPFHAKTGYLVWQFASNATVYFGMVLSPQLKLHHLLFTRSLHQLLRLSSSSLSDMPQLWPPLLSCLLPWSPIFALRHLSCRILPNRNNNSDFSCWTQPNNISSHRDFALFTHLWAILNVRPVYQFSSLLSSLLPSILLEKLGLAPSSSSY